MLTKIEIEKEKNELMKSLLSIADNDLTFLAVKSKIPYSRIYSTYHYGKITDRTLKMLIDSCFSDLISDGLKEYINDKFSK